jgi:hypothetical protein
MQICLQPEEHYHIFKNRKYKPLLHGQSKAFVLLFTTSEILILSLHFEIIVKLI